MLAVIQPAHCTIICLTLRYSAVISIMDHNYTILIIYNVFCYYEYELLTSII